MWWRAAGTPASVSWMRQRQGIAARRQPGSDSSASRRSPSVGRGSSRMGNCGARAMAADARMLLLDEPLTGLDPAQRAIMKRLLERLMKRLTLIVAVHHAEDLPRGMTHGLRLHNRRAYPSDSHSAT